MLIIFFFSSIILLLYFMLIVRYIYCWDNSKSTLNRKSDFYPYVSIVIVARNEECNIAKTLDCVSLQNYPNDKYELIIVNDNSKDGTQQIIDNYIKTHSNSFSIILDEKKNEFSKKLGIERAVSISKGTIILLVDADCVFKQNWIKTMVSDFIDDKTVFVSGPVVYSDKKNIFSKLLLIEFASLVGSGAASIMANKPIMCNGANMAYRKSAFISSIGYGDNKFIPSGDDVFLMLKLNKIFPNSIKFCKEMDAIVETESPSSITTFIQQRIRWTSKIKFYKENYIILNGVLVFLLNLLLFFLIVFSFFNIDAFYAFLAAFILKSSVDFVFMAKVLKFFQKGSHIKYIVLEEFLYIFYVIIVFFMSFRRSYFWKDRKLKT